MPASATASKYSVFPETRGAHVAGLPTRSKLGQDRKVATGYVCSTMALDAGQALKSQQEAMPMPNSITDETSDQAESLMAHLAEFFEHVESFAKYVSVFLTIVVCLLTEGSFTRHPRRVADA